MIQQKYIVAKDSQRKKIDDWFDHCEKERIPYIVVTLGTKYADIDLDPIAFPIEFDNYINKIEEQIIDRATRVFLKYKVKKSKIHADKVYVKFTNIPIEHAENAADDLFELFQSFFDDFLHNP